MGHRRIICIGDYDQYYDAKSYIHHKENPDYYHDLETGKRDEEDAYRWYAPDDIFGPTGLPSLREIRKNLIIYRRRTSCLILINSIHSGCMIMRISSLTLD